MKKFASRYIYNFSIFIFASLLVISSCKKDKIDPIDPIDPVPTTGTRLQLTKDSIFLYAKDTYLWNDKLPTYSVFNPRDYTNYELELNGIKNYAPLDKYSFIDDGTLAGELGGVAGDFGFSIFYNVADSSDLRIKYVYGSSPAASQGLKRGYRIMKLNGRTDLHRKNEATLDFVIDAIFGTKTNVNMTLRKPDGVDVDMNIVRGSYSVNPTMFTKVYTVGSKKVGYIVFNSFTTNSAPQLDEAFIAFSSAGISEVIVDLRYNGGGSVATSDVLTNLIAPASKSGSLMYTTYWTQKMQDGDATILENQKFTQDGKQFSFYDYDYSPTKDAGNVEHFEKRGTANISRAYFIVTKSTASASELVINNLKPVMDVKLIGSTTYGKPVGFFALRIDKLDLYIPQFQTKNSANFGDYFNGLAVDKEFKDDVTKEFGDPNEALLSLALGYAQTGTFAVGDPSSNTLSRKKSMATSAEMEQLTMELDKEFKGMVKTKFKIKK